ncbi:hypothetical protein IKF34_01485 [Candidatus Saccharibacteria bacterium]|nr:hypothetical protein [Candidatus Saccharibacteria bacterium]
MKTKHQKPDFTESDIKRFAQAFDILLEGAIQSRLIDEHGKLATARIAIHSEATGGGND